MSSQANYLASKVQTASQPELHLMLIDGAVRFVRQAREAWSNDPEDAEVDRLLDRALDLVEALVLGVRKGNDDLSRQFEQQYAFIFRELASSRINRNEQQLADALKLLTYERETWKLANDRTDPAATVPAPAMARRPQGDPAASFSLEA